MDWFYWSFKTKHTYTKSKKKKKFLKAGLVTFIIIIIIRRVMLCFFSFSSGRNFDYIYKKKRTILETICAFFVKKNLSGKNILIENFF